MPANRAASIARVEPHYLELVDYITSNPDTVISPASYLDWPRRDTSIDWSLPDASTVERSVGIRLSSLSAVVTLPVRPHVPSMYRRTVWLATLLEAGGAFYRTGHGKSASYVLDRHAAWRRTGTRDRVELVGHRWPHNPVAPVRKLMPTPVYEPDTPTPKPLRLVEPAPAVVSPDELAAPLIDRQLPPVAVMLDPTPDELTAAATAAAERPEAAPAPKFTVMALDPIVGAQGAITVNDDVPYMLIVTVVAVAPVVS
jgi:hypothetical protein